MILGSPRLTCYSFGLGVILSLVFICGQAFPMSDGLDDRLFELYQAGDLETVQKMRGKLPDSSAAAEFFKGVFETDGEAARFHYDRVLVIGPGSTAEGWALDKLWQYHLAKGDLKQAEKYWGFLKV